MTDQGLPGAHSLMQSFVATSSSVTISFMLYLRSSATEFDTPDTLDYNVFPNQQARVDLLNSSGTAFDLTNVVANLYQTQSGDPSTSGYSLISSTINNLTIGDTYQLRFAETDNLSNFDMGVDSVSVDSVTTPEPATLGLVGAFLVGIGLLKRKSSKSSVV